MTVKQSEAVLKELTHLTASELGNDWIYGNKSMNIRNYRFFRLTSIMFDEKFPQREAMENIISTLENEQFSFVYLLKGTPQEVCIYIGIAQVADQANMTVDKYANKLEAAFNGYFHGSHLQALDERTLQKDVFDEMQRYMRSSVVMGIPSVQKSAIQKNLNFQGLDRLVNSVGEGHWMAVVVAQRVNNKNISQMQQAAYHLYDTLHVDAKKTIQSSESETNGVSNSHSKSDTKGKGTSGGKNIVINRDRGDSENNGTSKNESVTIGDTEGDSYSKTLSLANTVEKIDKRCRSVLDYMDDVLFNRLKLAKAKGFYKTSIFLLGENVDVHERLKTSMLAIYQGDEQVDNPLRSYNLPKQSIDQIIRHIQTMQPVALKKSFDQSTALLCSMPTHNGVTELATYLTSQELSLVAGLPQKELCGIQLNEGVDFGLNVGISDTVDAIELGRIVNRGKINEANAVKLTPKQINKHIFIAGVTGSGKTTTCQKLLKSSGLPFLVIEPAKTEYRGMVKEMDNLTIYTLGNEMLSPFRLNPFELLKGESITSHVDMLKATFTAAFPMEAAMPQILEEAMYECYKDCGWNIEDNKNKYSKNPWNSNGEFFPTLDMLVARLKTVVANQGFGNELRDNYVGSLVSRLKNLTIGSKGLMLNCKLSIDFEKLLDERVIIEMEDIKSSEDKALLMGLILSRLSEALKLKYRQNNAYKHITLIEEAHRLLSKVEMGDAPSKKTAVETFSDMLAEVRKYGEGLVIVDQIPNKLASEVLKNTNTKIIHRIFARDDKEVIGDTMMMDARQKEFLSSLPVGQAILFSEGMHKPVVVAIKAATNTSDNEISEAMLKQLGERNAAIMPRVFYPLSSILKLPPSEEMFVKEQLALGLRFFKQYGKAELIYEAYEQLRKDIEPLQSKLGFTTKKMLEVLIYFKFYKEHSFFQIDYDFSIFSANAEKLYGDIKMQSINMGELMISTSTYYKYFG